MTRYEEKQIQGFISETVGTLEAIRNLGRKAYFTSIRPKVNVQVVNATQGQALLKIDIGTGLPDVLHR